MKKITGIVAIAAALACTTEKPATIDTPASNAAHSPLKDQWVLNYEGMGEVRAGMTVDQVNAILDNDLVIPSSRSHCEYMSLRTGPEGVSFLFEHDTLSVVDVKSGIVKTLEGAGIGDAESVIDSLYKGQVVTQPAKYTAGHRLIVTPMDGSDHRIVFETENGKVTRIASGREPAVEYVEGCG